MKPERQLRDDRVGRLRADGIEFGEAMGEVVEIVINAPCRRVHVQQPASSSQRPASAASPSVRRAEAQRAFHLDSSCERSANMPRSPVTCLEFLGAQTSILPAA